MGGRIIALGAILAGVAVLLGAFGSHGLRGRLEPEMLTIFHTGVEYQFYHALGLVLLGLFVSQGAAGQSSAATAAFWCFLLGILFFSGSLYVLTLSGVRWLGAITPIGGVGFMVGWVLFAWAALSR